jgi:hypothetical protein
MSKVACRAVKNIGPHRGKGAGAIIQQKPLTGFSEARLSGAGNYGGKGEISGLQAKLETHEPSSQYEQEADRVADSVVGQPDYRNHWQESEARKAMVPLGTSRSSLGKSAELPDSLTAAVKSGRGQPLDNASRRFMESRLGAPNFRDVKIHTDEEASEVARSLGAQAYTVGRDIGFARGLYSPGTLHGDRLLAHELVHVIQQQSMPRGSQTVLQRKPEGSARQPETQLASTYAAKERELLGRGVLVLPPGVNELRLLTNLQVGFMSGLADGLSRTIDPERLKAFFDGFEDIGNVFAFFAGRDVGVLVGITDGITDYAVGFYELAKLLAEGVEKIPTAYKVAFILNPLLAVPSILAKELYELLSDPEAVAQVRKIAQTIGKAFVEFAEYVQSNPDALVVEGEDLGQALGEFASEYFENMVLLEPDYYWKGVAVGNIVGRVGLEIALLFVAPEVLAARGVATSARAAASAIRGSRFAQRVLKVVDDVPGLRKLFGAIDDLVRGTTSTRKTERYVEKVFTEASEQSKAAQAGVSTGRSRVPGGKQQGPEAAKVVRRMREKLGQKRTREEATVAASIEERAGGVRIYRRSVSRAPYKRVSADAVKKRSIEIGHDLEPHNYDRNFVGEWYSSHAEKQLAVANPGSPLVVDRWMCPNCERFFSKQAFNLKKDLYVCDVEGGLWKVFYKDGGPPSVIVDPELISTLAQ